MRELTIDINVNLTDEVIEYIFDCWTQFVTQDLGYNVADLLMYEK